MLIFRKTNAASVLAMVGSTVLLAGCSLFSQEIRTEIPIEAAAESVWSTLTDFENFPKWNPAIRKIEGEPVKGKQLSVFVQLEGRRGMTFAPMVVKVEPERELRWLGTVGVRGITDGEHIFTIKSTGAQSVVFIHREELSGFFIPIGRAPSPATQ